MTCYSSASNYDNRKSHHTESGFRNPDPNFEKHGMGSLLRWATSRWTNEVSLNPEDYTIPSSKNDGQAIKEFKGKWSVTWVGHATTLIQIDGYTILTDPIWSDRCSPVSWAGPKRYTDPGIELDDLPKIDIVLISHNHYDHMDIPTLQELQKRFSPRFYVGLGNQSFLESEGLQNVKEMDWWDEDIFYDESKPDPLKVIFTPTQHFSSRGILDRDRTLWGSYLLLGSRSKIYFAGDTGYFDGFRTIAEMVGRLDLAILPIGAYEPRWFMEPVHVDPTQSVQAFIDLKASYMLPMHYSTFVLSDEPLDQPLQSTKKAIQEKGLPKSSLLGIQIGESFFRN
jgi:L-ascorbate metabolism protein UlaG (beta-lactamase superfamily)